ncbi:hypothetical protein MC885_014728, partial [Smutsia gigantea]
MSRLDVYLAQIPAGTSAQNIQHRAQAANSVTPRKETAHYLRTQALTPPPPTSLPCAGTLPSAAATRAPHQSPTEMLEAGQ